LLLGSLALVIVALLTSVAVGQEEDLPVKIKADFFRYDRRTRVLTATGNVVLTFEDVTIRSDALVANLETGAVTAEGHVILEAAGQSAAGDLLTYNLNTRLGELVNARTDYTGPLVLGRIHLRARRVLGIPNQFGSIRDAFLTTCDEDDPVVHLTADEITVFVNDKIVGQRVSLWVGGRKLFTLPQFVIFLRERRESRLVPVVGYSEIEGWFVRSAYTYFINEDHYGILHGDWMERIGVGLGVEHIYRLAGGQGSAFVYRLSNKQTGGADLRAVLSHWQPIGESVTARVYADYLGRSFSGGLSSTDVFGALDLSAVTARSATFLFTTMSQSSFGPTSFMTSRFAHSQTFSPELFGEVSADFSRSLSTLGMDDELFPRLALRYFGRALSASLVAETRLDLDGDRFPGDARYVLERLPEFTFAMFPMRIGSTPLIAQLEGGLGRFRETTIAFPGGVLDAGRADLLATVSGPIQIGQRGTLGMRLFTRGTWYTAGGALRLFYGGRLEYIQPVTEHVETRLGYTGQAVQGTSPFVFDQIFGTFSVADAQISFRTDDLFVRTTALYDFQLRQFGNVITQAFYVPRPGWNIGAAASYNVNLGRLDRVEASLDLRLSDEWQFQYIGAYDGFTRRLTFDRVSVTKVFCDCLAVSLTYLGAQQEIWLEAWLTAIPWGRGRIGIGGRGQLLFDQPIPFLQQP
jgi:hypothetical protein